MKRINVLLDEKDNQKAVKKAEKTLGIKSLSALLRYMLKAFIKNGL